jgi:hypothetical protein
MSFFAIADGGQNDRLKAVRVQPARTEGTFTRF